MSFSDTDFERSIRPWSPCLEVDIFRMYGLIFGVELTDGTGVWSSRGSS